MIDDKLSADRLLEIGAYDSWPEVRSMARELLALRAALCDQAKPPVAPETESRTETVPAEPPKRSYTERAQVILRDENSWEATSAKLLVLLIEMLEARGGAK